MSFNPLLKFNGDENISLSLSPQVRSASSASCPKCYTSATRTVDVSIYHCSACGDFCHVCRSLLAEGCVHHPVVVDEHINTTKLKDYAYAFAENQMAAEHVAIRSPSNGKFLTLKDKFGALSVTSYSHKDVSTHFFMHKLKNNTVWLQASDLSFVVVDDGKVVSRFVSSYNFMLFDAPEGRKNFLDLAKNEYLILGSKSKIKTTTRLQNDANFEIVPLTPIGRPPSNCSYHFGDILFVDHGSYQHYAMYTGWQYYNGAWTEVVAHYFNDVAGGIKWLKRERGFAFVQYSSLPEFAQGLRIQVDKSTTKDSPDMIFQRLQSKLGEESYSLMGNNCEHVTRFMAGGTSYSAQVLAKTSSKKLNAVKELEKSRAKALKPFLLRLRSNPDLYLTVRHLPQKGYTLLLEPKDTSHQTWIRRSDARLEQSLFLVVLESHGQRIQVGRPDSVTQEWTLENGVICEKKSNLKLVVEDNALCVRSDVTPAFWEMTDQL